MATHAEMAERKEKVAAAMRRRPAATVDAIAEEVGLSRIQTVTVLSHLRDDGIVSMTQQRAYVLTVQMPQPRSRDGLSAIERRKDMHEWVSTALVSPSLQAMARAYRVSLAVIQKDVRMMCDAGALDVDPTLSQGHQVVATGKPWRDPAAGRALSQRPYDPSAWEKKPKAKRKG